MNLIELYKTQLRVMWNWKGGPLGLIWRFVLTILVAAVSFLVTDWIMPDITVDGVGDGGRRGGGDDALQRRHPHR